MQMIAPRHVPRAAPRHVPRHILAPLLRPLIAAAQAFLARRALARSRAQLAALEPHRLRDIGLSQTAAAREAQIPVWDAPHHWLRR